MRTNPECIPCFRRQAHYAAGLVTNDPAVRAAIDQQVEDLLAGLDLAESPPVNSIALYRLISQVSQNRDPFAGLKQQSNDLALRLRPQLEALIRQADDSLRRAILFAMAGNIIDYGSQQDFDLDKTLRHCLENQPIIDDYAELCHDLAKARTILYLADNCGEIVFDGLLIDQLPGAITMAVKDGPIINDATMADATYCGLDRKCRVLSNGAVCPGTPLTRCGKEFLELFEGADVVISKGQGNFETLSEARRKVFHLLTVKCPVVADHVAEQKKYPGRITTGAVVLMRLGGA